MCPGWSGCAGLPSQQVSPITCGMNEQSHILCIGAALWDIIGRTPAPMRIGSDVAGRITRIPGGVALNIAMALVRAGARPDLLAAVGQDAAGDALVADMAAYGVSVQHLYRAPRPAHRYLHGHRGRGRTDRRHCPMCIRWKWRGPKCWPHCAMVGWQVMPPRGVE